MYAKYTEVLKNLMENPQTKQLLDKALSTYPLYEKKSKEEYLPSIVPTRSELNQKILNHYKYREIGFETVGRFLDELEISMIEIMPYYNQLFFSADQDFNIIYNVDYQRTTTTGRTGTTSDTITGTNNGTSKTTDSGKVDTEDRRSEREDMESSSESRSTSETNSQDTSETSATVENFTKNVHSGTPQGNLSIPAENIDSVKFADDASWNKSKNTDSARTTGSSSGNTETNNSGSSEGSTEKTSEGTNNVTSSNESNTTTTGENNTTAAGTKEETENILETTKGNFGVVSAQDLISKYRDTILNIEQMIINDQRIRELFMGVF